jgi:hypothetical protein
MKAESNLDAERSRRPRLSNFRSGISDHIEQCGLHGKIATEISPIPECACGNSKVTASNVLVRSGLRST